MPEGDLDIIKSTLLNNKVDIVDKRNHSRQRVGKMTNQQFCEWSEEARKKRDECEARELTLDDLTLF